MKEIILYRGHRGDESHSPEMQQAIEHLRSEIAQFIGLYRINCILEQRSVETEIKDHVEMGISRIEYQVVAKFPDEDEYALLLIQLPYFAKVSPSRFISHKPELGISTFDF